jgi:quaternary ammonium compound-resistance protein SugE
MEVHHGLDYLFVAGLFEVAWAIGLKYTDGFRACSVIVDARRHGVQHNAARTCAENAAGGNRLWSDRCRAVGTAALGIYLFDDPATIARISSIALIVAGIVGLKVVT